jgi:hypothetical protein
MYESLCGLIIWVVLSSLQLTVGLDGKKLEPESNVLLASIENMQYAVTLDVLHMVLTITSRDYYNS